MGAVGVISTAAKAFAALLFAVLIAASCSSGSDGAEGVVEASGADGDEVQTQAAAASEPAEPEPSESEAAEPEVVEPEPEPTEPALAETEPAESTDSATGASASDQEYIDAMVAEMEGEMPGNIDATCLGEQMVASLGGAEGIQASYGLDPAEFAGPSANLDMVESDARRAVDAMWQCDGFADMLYMQAAFQIGGEESLDCVRGVVSEGHFKTIMTASLMGELGRELEAEVAPELQAEIFEAMTECAPAG